MSNILIEVKNLKCILKPNKRLLLDNISIDIYENSVTALIGPSGSGKSTFLRTINRMNDIHEDLVFEGQLNFEGSNILDLKGSKINDLRTKIGMVFQKPTPFPMSIYDNVAFGPRAHGIRSRKELDEIVISSLKSAALYDEVKDKIDSNALSLSGGQQQRLCIARAIAVKPKILLMDEPTSALDPISTASIEQLISKLSEKYTIIIVTHSMHQAQRVSDYTVLFMGGKLEESGTTQQIFSKPKKKTTLNYITGR